MSEVKKVVTQVDRSTKALTKVAGDVQKIVTDLVGLTTISEGLAGDIEQKTSELGAIEVTIAETERQAKADLKIRIVENEDNVVASLMQKRGLATISKTDLSDLSQELVDAQEDNTVAIEAAVSQAEKNAAVTTNAIKANLQSAHAVETAELKANNAALSNKVGYLEESVASLKQMLEAERTARVEMSANQSQPTINVSGVK